MRYLFCFYAHLVPKTVPTFRDVLQLDFFRSHDVALWEQFIYVSLTPTNIPGVRE